MKRILLFITVLLIALPGFIMAQRTVTGSVTAEEDGTPIPGVNVIVKGTSVGTVTDIDGKYQIAVTDGGDVLVFSFIGLATEEVEVGSQSIIDMVMTADLKQLNEIVVIGYGVSDKRTLTSSIASVDGEELAAMPVPSFDVALQGKVAGMQVSTTSGILGEAPKIRIRGVNSITSGTYPLVVVDGVPIETGNFSGVADNNGLADINPSDIESFEVLKDGAATAIYGSRAANGVILITTKSGKAGKTSVSYDFYAGYNETANRFDILNADEFVLISNEKFATADIAPQAFPGPDNVYTDWQDVIFRKGFVQNHNLGITGGSDAAQYYVSANYMNQEGAIVNNSIERFSLRGNLDYTGVDWLEAGVKIQASQQRNSGLNTGTNALSGNVSNAIASLPNIRVMNPDHPTGYNLTADNNAQGMDNNLQVIASNLTNIKYVLDHNQQDAVVQRLLASGYAQVNLPLNLRLRTQLGVDISDTRDFLSWDPIHGDGNPTGYVYRGYYNATTWNWHNTLSYSTSIADNHNISVVIGNEYQSTKFDQFTAEGQDFSDVFFIKEGLISNSYNVQYSGGYVGVTGFDSYFGRANYDYKGRYLISLSARRDALSSLPPANREGVFLGASVGWNIAEESFFNVTAIDQLKIRGGYAETGNTDIGMFPYLGTYGGELYGANTALAFKNVGNSDLKWETSLKYNVGIDFGFLDSRISGSIDWYKNDVNDLILAAPTPPSLGIPNNSITKNIGSLTNTGIEFNVNTINIKGNNFQWSSNLNFTTNQNEITTLANDNADVPYTYNILRVGEPLGAIFGYVYNGVNAANGNPIYTKADGTLIQGNPDDNKYYVYNPQNPGDVSEVAPSLSFDDKVVLGHAQPKIYGGFGNMFTFKGLELNVALTYAFGQQVMNVTQQEGLAMEFKNNFSKIKNRWTPENTDTDVPRLSYANSSFLNTTQSASSRFVEDADFVRIQNVTLAYNLPDQIYSGIGLTRLRVYAQVQNAYVFTNYSGLDPELTYSNTSNINAGVDYNTNPLMRTYTVGLNVGF